MSSGDNEVLIYDVQEIQLGKLMDFCLKWVHKALPIPPPRVDSSKGPHRVNRAHWPTKENRQNFGILDFSGLWKKWPQMAPNGNLEAFFLLIQTLPTFWAEWI